MNRLLGRSLLVLAAVWALAPLAWAFLCSIKQPVDVFSMKLIPFLQFDPTLEHWKMELTQRGAGVWISLKNSVLVAACSSLLALALAAPAGYALSRMVSDRGRKRWWLWLISQRFLPPVVLMVPFFLLMKSVSLLDSPVALILVHAAMNAPFAALILQDVFAELPQDLEEAAFVDGASPFQAFCKIILPLTLPAVAAAGVLCVAFSWNEFLYALTLTYRDAVTMPVFIAGSEHVQGIEFWYVSTRSLLAVIPPAILALFAQRFLVRGLTLGAVKE